jgi:hypothetical protein
VIETTLLAFAVAGAAMTVGVEWHLCVVALVRGAANPATSITAAAITSVTTVTDFMRVETDFMFPLRESFGARTELRPLAAGEGYAASGKGALRDGKGTVWRC